MKPQPQLPKASDLASRWLTRLRRDEDIQNEMSELMPAQVGSVDLYSYSEILLRKNRLRILETRKDAKERHGQKMPEYRYDERRIEKEMSSFEQLRKIISSSESAEKN